LIDPTDDFGHITAEAPRARDRDILNRPAK
jgi:hypothetical protein